MESKKILTTGDVDILVMPNLLPSVPGKRLAPFVKYAFSTVFIFIFLWCKNA